MKKTVLATFAIALLAVAAVQLVGKRSPANKTLSPADAPVEGNPQYQQPSAAHSRDANSAQAKLLRLLSEVQGADSTAGVAPDISIDQLNLDGHDFASLYYGIQEVFDIPIDDMSPLWRSLDQTATAAEWAITINQYLRKNARAKAAGELNIVARSPQQAATSSHSFCIVEYLKEVNGKAGSYYAVDVHIRGSEHRVQRIDNLECNVIDMDNRDHIELGDYNFDGLTDVKLFCERHAYSGSSYLLLKDPDAAGYIRTKAVNAAAVFDSEKKLMITEDYFQGEKIVRHFRWEGANSWLAEETIYVEKKGVWVEK